MTDLKIKKLPVRTDYLNGKIIDVRLPQHRFRLGIIAPSFSGKTNLILSLIKERRFYYGYFKIFIFSKSIYNDPIFDNIDIAEKYLCNELSESKIEKILKHQKYLKEKYEDEGRLEKLPKILMIIDDCAGDSQLLSRTSIINELFFRGRHSNLSLIVVSQAYKMISKNIRTNFSDIILFGAENDGETKAISEENSGGLSKKNFEKLFKYATAERFQFLYVARKYKHRKRFRKNFNTTIYVENGKVEEEPLILDYPKVVKNQPKVRPSKINFKPIPPKKNKKYSYADYLFENIPVEEEEEESESSEYNV
tara:strand:- start:5973 stop:6896 length:924 start_codon:yes stop_codon:yes gene_type:complete